MPSVKLKELHLKNFKSFTNAKIPLKSGLTVFVGSNGSGKTNILDGLLFVLGTTSLKLLRASKLVDLINQNSAEHYGKVELSIDDGAKSWMISRLIDNRGKSVYRLNDDRKALNEIESFLNELGIRNDGHNIVAQGDVTRVIEKNPVERREIIDEIAGIREFDEKKLEAEKELEKVDEKIKDTRIVLNERLAYLNKLEEEKNVALEFEHLETRKKQLKASILFQEIDVADSVKKDNVKRLSDVEKELVVTLNSEKEFLAKEDALRNAVEAINSFLLSENQRVYAEVSAELESTRAKQAVAVEKKQSAESLIKRNEAKEKELIEKISIISKEKSSLKERVSKIDNSLQGLEQQIKAKEKEKEGFAVGKKQSSEKVAEINKKRLAIETEIDSLNALLHNKRVEFNSIQKHNVISSERIADLSKQISSLQNELHEMEKKSQLLNSLHFKSSNPSEELKGIEEKLYAIIEEEQEKKASIVYLQNSLKQLEALDSLCPVCENVLPKEKKHSIVAKKKQSLKEHESSRSVLLEKSGSLKKRIIELQKFVKEEQLLISELKYFEEKKIRLKDLQELLVKEKQSVKEPSSLKSEIASLQEKLEKFLKEKFLVLKEVEKTQVGFIDKSFEEFTNKFSALMNEKHALVQEKNSIAKILLPKTEKELESYEKELHELGNEIVSLKKNFSLLEKEIVSHVALLEKLQKRFETEKIASEQKAKQKDSLNEKIVATREKQETIKQKLLRLNKQQTEIQVSIQNIDIKINDLNEELKGFEGVQRIHRSLRELREEIPVIEKRIEKLGAINLKAIDSCEELRKEFDDVKVKVEKLEQERLAVLDLMDKIEVKRKNVFMDCFNAINANFSKMFMNLFNGEGALKLTDENEPFNAGLIIEAQHKGKGLQRIDAMSGGEKSLTALAFLFAIQLHEPAPFYVFDEADAALDKENSLKLMELMKQMSDNTQFLVISHNDAVIKNADQIVGVTLNQNKSSVIGLNLKI